MDEPLSNLDAKLRVETRANIAALQARLGTTTLYVTHDQVEAMTMGNRVAVLKDGLLQQADTPRNLYDHPVNVFVAGFIGSPAMNLRTAGLVDGGGLSKAAARLGDLTIALDPAAYAAAKAANLDEVTIGVRPEEIDVVDEPTGLKMTVELVEELGADAFVYGTLPSDEADTKHLVARPRGRRTPQIGDVVNLAINDTSVHAFNPGTGLRLA